MSVHDVVTSRKTDNVAPVDGASAGVGAQPIDTRVGDVGINHLPPAPKPPSEAARIAKRLTKHAVVGAVCSTLGSAGLATFLSSLSAIHQ